VAKKSRRKGNIRLSPTQMMQPGVDGVDDVVPQALSQSAGVSLQEEYQDVVVDLKRVGLIAAAVLAVLVVLVFVLP